MKQNTTSNAEIEDVWWQACRHKDTAFLGQFVIAVRTTGIYCLPTCPARPLRKNVEFFRTNAAAELHGFRPCKRCKPTNPFTSVQEHVIRACEFITANRNARLKDLATALEISPFYLQRVFKATLGISPAQYARTQKVEHLKANLKDGKAVIDAAYT